MNLSTAVLLVLALVAVAFACDPFERVQDCRAFDAQGIYNEVCTLPRPPTGFPGENPHFLWFKGWSQAPFVEEDLIIDTTGSNPGFGRFLRDAGGNTLVTAALCSRIACDSVKFNLALTLTGLQQPSDLNPLTSSWDGNYPITGGLPGFPAAPALPKRELVLNNVDYPMATGDCKCLHEFQCPAAQLVPTASDCWDFYTSPTLQQARGIVTGASALTDGMEIEFTLYRTTGTTDYRLLPQRGFGANDKNEHDGFAMWFNWKVNRQGNNPAFQLPIGEQGWDTEFNFDSGVHGDVNLELNCNSPVTDVECVDLVDGFDCQKTHEDQAGPCIEVITSTSTFRATGDHLISTPQQGWKLIRELRVGDVLRTGIIESVRETVCKSLNSCLTDNQRFDAYGEIFAQNGLITPDNYKEMLIE